MSCHDIGRGLNTVVQVVMTLFDEGKVDLDAAREIVYACRKGVHWCDGNEYEALESIYTYRCGRCLERVEKGGLLFDTNDFWRLSYRSDRDLPDGNKIRDNCKIQLASHKLCRECFVRVVNDYYQREDAGEEMIDVFIANLEEKDYVSTGGYVN